MYNKAVLIPTDGEPTLTEVNGLSDLQSAVGDGYIEAVTLRDGAHVYVNEEGKLKRLPVNGTATALCRAFGYIGSDVICGPAIVLGDGEDGNEADCPQWVLDRLHLV